MKSRIDMRREALAHGCSGSKLAMKEARGQWGSSGIRRVVRALGNSYAGLRHGLAHDPAIRQVLGTVALLMLVAAICWLVLVGPLVLRVIG